MKTILGTTQLESIRHRSEPQVTHTKRWKSEPSGKEEALLRFVSGYLKDVGFPPAIREIMIALHISSTSVVNYYIDNLEKKGYMLRTRRTSRGLTITRKGRTFLGIAEGKHICPNCGMPLDAPVPVKKANKQPAVVAIPVGAAV